MPPALACLQHRPQAAYNRLNMADESPVNKRGFTHEEGWETAELGGAAVARDEEGVWRYVETWIPVPGASDVTLSERFKPKLIISPDEEVIERVVVSGESIAEAPDLLHWCLKEGTPISEDGEVVEVFVPYDVWLDHDRVPGALTAPEIHGDEAEQELAMAERQWRENEVRFHAATAFRAHVLRRRADELTRQRAREITGLSVGRIQQLIRADTVTVGERRLLELFEGQPIPTLADVQELAAEADLPRASDVLGPAIQELEARGFLQEVADGMALTPAGEQLIQDIREAEGEAEAEAG